MGRMIGLVLVLGVLVLGAAAFGQDTTTPSGQPGGTPAASSGTEPQGATTAATQPQQSIWPMVIILVVFVAVFYFMLIRPQRKRQAQHNLLLKDLKRGDNVMTAGGIYGEIDSVGDTTIVMTVEDGGKLKVAKSSIIDKRAK